MVPIVARVRGRRRETRDTWTLAIDAGGLAFRPGQFNAGWRSKRHRAANLAWRPRDPSGERMHETALVRDIARPILPADLRERINSDS